MHLHVFFSSLNVGRPSVLHSLYWMFATLLALLILLVYTFNWCFDFFVVNYPRGETIQQVHTLSYRKMFPIQVYIPLSKGFIYPFKKCTSLWKYLPHVHTPFINHISFLQEEYSYLSSLFPCLSLSHSIHFAFSVRGNFWILQTSPAYQHCTCSVFNGIKATKRGTWV